MGLLSKADKFLHYTMKEAIDEDDLLVEIFESYEEDLDDYFVNGKESKSTETAL